MTKNISLLQNYNQLRQQYAVVSEQLLLQQQTYKFIVQKIIKKNPDLSPDTLASAQHTYLKTHPHSEIAHDYEHRRAAIRREIQEIMKIKTTIESIMQEKLDWRGGVAPHQSLSPRFRTYNKIRHKIALAMRPTPPPASHKETGEGDLNRL